MEQQQKECRRYRYDGLSHLRLVRVIEGDHWIQVHDIQEWIAKNECDELEVHGGLVDDFSSMNIDHLSLKRGAFDLTDPRLPTETPCILFLVQCTLVKPAFPLKPWKGVECISLMLDVTIRDGKLKHEFTKGGTLFPRVREGFCASSDWRLLPARCETIFNPDLFTFAQGMEILRKRPACMAVNLALQNRRQVNELARLYRHRPFHMEVLFQCIYPYNASLDTYAHDSFQVLWDEQRKGFATVVTLFTKRGRVRLTNDTMRSLFSFLFC